MSQIYLQQALARANNFEEPNYTPAQQLKINELTAEFDNAVNNGVDPLNVVKMITIMSILENKGIATERLQNNHQLIAQLCLESNFDLRDANINYIFERVNAI